MAIGVVATYNGSYHSPGFDVNVSGLSGYDTLTVERVDLTGEYPDTPVRGADRASISGDAFSITDFEAPIGKNLVYRATATSVSATDTFTRTVSGGWGQASFGQSWALDGSPSQFSTNGSSGVIAVNALATTFRARIGEALTDADVKVKVTIPVAITGTAPIHVGVVARFVDPNNYYLASLVIDSSGSATVLIQRVIGGVFTSIGSVPIDGDHVAGASWFIRAQVVGSVISAKAWRTNATEPAWALSGSAPDTTAAGQVGVRVRTDTGMTNTLPINIAFDDFTIAGIGSNAALTSVGTSSSTGAQDTFTRSTSNGWGTPDVGAGWAVRSGPVGDFSTVSVHGRMSMTQRSVNGSFGTDYIMEVPLPHTDLDQKARFRTSIAAAGDVYRMCLKAREVDRNNYWEFEANCAPSGEVRVRLGRRVAGVEWHSHLDNGIIIPGLTHTAGSWYWLRFQVVGNKLRGKVWKDGTSEPDWQIETESNVVPSGSYAGVSSFSSAFSTNPTPEIVEWDDYSAIILNNDNIIPYSNPGDVWLKSVGQPALSRKVNLSAWTETSHPGRVLGEYNVLGRRNKVVLMDVLGGREGTIVLATYKNGAVWENDSSYRDLVSLLEAGGTLLVQTTGIDDTGEEDMYFEVTSVKRSRVGVVGGDFAHLFEVSFIEVDRPSSDQESLTLRDWQSVLDQNATWQSVLSNHSTWLDVLQRNL